MSSISSFLSLLLISAFLSFSYCQSDCQTLSYFQNDECAQLCLNSTLVPLVLSLPGVGEGTCASIGFPVFDRDEQVEGQSMQIYKKGTTAPLTNLLGDDPCVTLYKISGSECGQLCVASNIVSYVVEFGGVTEGNCAGQGFTVFEKTQNIDAGPFGSLQVNVYTKPASFLQ